MVDENHPTCGHIFVISPSSDVSEELIKLVVFVVAEILPTRGLLLVETPALIVSSEKGLRNSLHFFISIQLVRFKCLYLCYRRPLFLSLRISLNSPLLGLRQASQWYGHDKQAGSGPNRRHIEGSKIAKGLQSVEKTLYPNFENVISEFRKRYIRILKMLYPYFENVISELRKRYIRILKMSYPNFENVIS